MPLAEEILEGPIIASLHQEMVLGKLVMVEMGGGFEREEC